MATKLIPLGVTTREVIRDLVKSQKTFKRAIHAEWIKPTIGGGKGCRAIWDYKEVCALWQRIKKEGEPPLLPCEIKARKLLNVIPAGATVGGNRRAS